MKLGPAARNEILQETWEPDEAGRGRVECCCATYAGVSFDDPIHCRHGRYIEIAGLNGSTYNTEAGPSGEAAEAIESSCAEVAKALGRGIGKSEK